MMTNPLTIRAVELIHSLCDAAGVTRQRLLPKFSLNPQLLFSDPAADPNDEWRAYANATDPRAEHWVGMQSLLSILLEREAVDFASAEPASQNWANAMSAAAVDLNSGSRDRTKLRRATLNHVIQDLGHELPVAAAISGMSPEHFADWIRYDAEAAIQELPALGRYRELIHRRLVDPGRRWHGNDLVDLVFLTAAAGYADFVVCERRTGEDLRRAAESVSPGASVHPNLADLVDDLGL